MARRRDGTEFPVLLGINEIFSGAGRRYFCGFVHDLTATREHEQELQEQQDLAQAMINASFDPMLQIDQDGIICIVNDAACIMLGYQRDELIGENVNIICGGTEHAGHHHDEYIQRYLETGQKRIIGCKRQVMARRKDNTEFPVELGVQEVKLASGKLAFCGYIRDLTQQHKDKRALRKQADLIHGKFFAKSENDEN